MVEFKDLADPKTTGAFAAFAPRKEHAQREANGEANRQA